jgi:hypothetical protein
MAVFKKIMFLIISFCIREKKVHFSHICFGENVSNLITLVPGHTAHGYIRRNKDKDGEVPRFGGNGGRVIR